MEPESEELPSLVCLHLSETVQEAPTQEALELKEQQEEQRLAEIVFAHISADEALLVRQLCERVSHLKENSTVCKQVHPYTLIRFLRARNGDITKAAQMFQDSMQWRIDERIDERVSQWNVEIEQNITPRSQLVNKHWFMAPMGVCAQGLPVLVSRVGRSDPGGLERECGWESFLLQHVAIAEFQVEEARRRTLETGKLLLAFVAIYDLAGGAVPKWTARAWSSVDPFKRLAPILDLNYPERLARAFIVNVPWAFKMFWNMFTPIIPKGTLEKLSLHTTAWVDPMTTGDVPWLIREQIPADLLLDGASLPPQVEAAVRPGAGIVGRGVIKTI